MYKGQWGTPILEKPCIGISSNKYSIKHIERKKNSESLS
jgi:hypothetical protein